MKRHIILAIVLSCAAAAMPRSLHAAVPLRWTVETSRVQPVAFDAIRGETLSLEASFNSYGTPLSMAGKPCAIYYQTNGMGSAWWTSTAAAVSNRVTATFTPSMDPGAATVRGFLGATGDIYRAEFTLRFRHGPGAAPNALEPPVRVLDLGHTVVVNPPWPTTNDFRAATNDMQATLKTYVDSQIEGAGVVSHQIVTNIVDGKIADKRDKTDMFTEWTTSVGISPYTMRWYKEEEMGSGWSPSDSDGWVGGKKGNASSTTLSWSADEWAGGFSFTATRQRILTTADSSSFATTNDITSTVTKSYVESLGISSGVTSVNSKTGAVQLVASDVGAYPNSSGQQLAAQVSTIGSHLNAEDAKFVVTNYNSNTKLPEASVELKLPDKSWATVWREMTRWNYLFDTYLPTNYVTKAELAEKADRAWGYYDSHTGAYAPEGYTWISSPRIAIAADLAYQRTITSEGAIWVLESNGMVTETGGVTSNGFFRITDDEGNAQFEIVKGSTRTIGADASSCQVVSGFTPTKLQIGYSVVSKSHPTLYVCASLSNQTWKAETDADCLANVTWSGASGAYVAQVQAKSAQPSLFVKAGYQTGSESLIRNVAPVSMTHIYIGSTKYAVSTNTISGHIVLTLTPAQ